MLQYHARAVQKSLLLVILRNEVTKDLGRGGPLYIFISCFIGFLKSFRLSCRIDFRTNISFLYLKSENKTR